MARTLVALLAGLIIGINLVSAPAFALARRMGGPALAQSFEIPTRREIDGRLLSGAAIFGIGWGLVGLCPGPALGFGFGPASLFAGSMVAGLVIFHLTLAPRASTGDFASTQAADA